MSSSVLVVDSFRPRKAAQSLRAYFDDRFAPASSGRFVWDYWEVPDQYRLLRTPAHAFFPRRAYEDFHRSLVLWGRENLGCHDISPPWLSCYVEGCGQELHGDLPHGPWAFVYSLTSWESRKFSGGETLLLKDEILDYWNRFRSGRGLEHGGIFRSYPARFNRLLVFDPRVPHGVKRLQGGVHDVREGRLVIHGWFVQPRPFIEGSLSPRALSQAVAELGGALDPVLGSGAPVNGVLSLRMNIPRSGKIRDLRALTDSLRSGDPRQCQAIRAAVRGFFRNYDVGKQRGSSRVTLPLIFETS
jgi:hypothetical protein